MKTHFPDPSNLLNFTLTISPDEGAHPYIDRSLIHWQISPLLQGMYKGGAFVFSFVINTNYPHEPPKVKCTQTVSERLFPKGLCFSSMFRHVFRLSSDLPPERWSRGQRVPQHSQRRLEASPQLKFGYGRLAVPLPRAKCGRPFEQRYSHLLFHSSWTNVFLQRLPKIYAGIEISSFTTLWPLCGEAMWRV